PPRKPAELARHLHLTEAAISGWLHATRRISVPDLHRVAEYTGQTLWSLMGVQIDLSDGLEVMKSDTSLPHKARTVLIELYQMLRERPAPTD
ncbi:MAG: helix-turn-helix transcriptional regulator, partial [Armatimonadota bacterium]